MRSPYSVQLFCAALMLGAVRSAVPPPSSPSSLSPPSIQSGALQVSLDREGNFTLQISGMPSVGSQPLSLFVDGATHTIANKGLHCGATTSTSGADRFGAYSGLRLNCTANASTRVSFEWKAYAPLGGTGEGRLVATVNLPDGANGTDAQPGFSAARGDPRQFAPFPAFAVEGAFNVSVFRSELLHPPHTGNPLAYTASRISNLSIMNRHSLKHDALSRMRWKCLVSLVLHAFAYSFRSLPIKTIDSARKGSGFLCYGADKAHMFSVHAKAAGGLGGANAFAGQKQSCFTLGGGPAALFWGPGGKRVGEKGSRRSNLPPSLRALVVGPASAFHLNYHTRLAAPATSTVEKAGRSGLTSGATVGSTAAGAGGGVGLGANICTPTWGTDYVCCDMMHVVNITTPAACCAQCQSQPGCTAWKLNTKDPTHTCFLKSGKLTNPVACPDCVVGQSAGGGGGGGGDKVWSFGVSGDVMSVPAGFRQSTMLVYSDEGLNAAWDGWGGAIRKAYDTDKKADEDVFLSALSIWTDNGAATLGAGWRNIGNPKATPPPYTKLGGDVGFMNWNWSMVSTEVLGNVADGVRATGIAPRGAQLDCWWYPVQLSNHPFWCVSDWVLPEQYYPNGTGGVRDTMGVPLILYFPALCVDNAWNASGKYTWSDTKAKGFVVPIAEQSAMFWGDMFDYGAKLAAKSIDPAALPWPGVWAPPMVRAAWQGTNLAAYETDFYHNIVAETPEFRQRFGAGEMFLDGINTACADRNMTAQLCAGNPPSFLEALTMPSITNARASIDYDWGTVFPFTIRGRARTTGFTTGPRRTTRGCSGRRGSRPPRTTSGRRIAT